MIRITRSLSLPETDIEFSAIRAQGAGGQNVNKVSSAIHLRLDIRASSLPERYKQQLLDYRDNRISKDGVIIIKAQNYRTQEQNRAEALARLSDLIREATAVQKVRRPTRPTRSSKNRRMDAKTHRGKIKAMRSKSFD